MRLALGAKCGAFGASALVGAVSDAIIMRNPSRPKPAADWRRRARRGSCLASWSIAIVYSMRRNVAQAVAWDRYCYDEGQRPK